MSRRRTVLAALLVAVVGACAGSTAPVGRPDTGLLATGEPGTAAGPGEPASPLVARADEPLGAPVHEPPGAASAAPDPARGPLSGSLIPSRHRVPDPPEPRAAPEAPAPEATTPATEAPTPEEAVEPAPAPACEPAPADLVPVPTLSHGSRSQRSVALTFDDGWNAENIGRIVATLQAERVNATFFPIGSWLADLPATWRAVAAAGFPIANHTYSHAALAGRCYGEQLAELQGFTAEATRLGIVPFAVMRPPGDRFDAVTTVAARAAGQQAMVVWDVDTEDWNRASVDQVTARALAGREGSIVLMHTFPGATAAALPGIIAGYRARGFAFVTVGTLLGLGGPVPFG